MNPMIMKLFFFQLDFIRSKGVNIIIMHQDFFLYKLILDKHTDTSPTGTIALIRF